MRNASLMKDLDGKAARSGKVKGPGPVHVLRLAGLHSCLLEPVVDLVDPVVGISWPIAHRIRVGLRAA
jgi:hypothetical protein